MRSIWKGALSFGLINIPVKLYSATERKSVRFSFIHRACGTRVEYRKWCPTCDCPVAQEEIARGHEIAPGQYVLVEDEELASLQANPSRNIEIVSFVSQQEIDPVYYDKSYFLEPGEGGTKAYSLFRSALYASGQVALARLVLRRKESLAMVRIYDPEEAAQGLLMLETMFYPDEVRSTKALVGVDAEITASERETLLAQELIERLSESFSRERFQDRYREAVLDLIRARADARVVRPVLPQAPVEDLMTALQASLAAVKEEQKGRGEHLH